MKRYHTFTLIISLLLSSFAPIHKDIIHSPNDPHLESMLKAGIAPSDLLWLEENPAYVTPVIEFLQESNFDKHSLNATIITLRLAANNLLFTQQNYSEREAKLANKIYAEIENDCCPLTLDPIAGLYHYANISEEYALLKQQWIINNSDYALTNIGKIGLYLKAQWNVSVGTLHTALDVCGLIVALGEPCDLVNGVLYTIEGDGVNATFSFGAMIPVYGWSSTGAKYAVLIGKNLNNNLKYALRYKRVNGKVEFRIRGKTTFREIVGVTDEAYEAHHLIPQALTDNDVVQQAAKATNDHWHLHMPDNGMAAEKFTYNYAPNGIHANHPQYNRKVEEKLEQLKKRLLNDFDADDIEDVPADVVSAALQVFQNQLRTLIQNNPTTKINDLTIP